MSLREDNGPYCLIWLGVLLMGAYYTNFAYQIIVSAVAAGAFFNNFGFMLGLLVLPPLMVFFFVGYLRPTRGRAKMTMLGPSVFLGVIFVILTSLVAFTPGIEYFISNILVFSAWGIGSAILTAGGFSIVQSYDQSTSSGMLDVSSLHYGPPKEEEPEVEEEPEKEDEPEPVAEVTETPETSDESSTDSENTESDEPVSE